ncbi:MAG TPA: amino acid adenylation domain-containing protein [Ferruginibacter sp.]|nr:amino acid adenylation domain-containing protein [Ferruginibacter sp.]
MDYLLQTAFEDDQEAFENSVLYWKQQLESNTPFVELSPDFSRSSTTSSKIDQISFSLSSFCRDKLRQLSDCHNTSLFTTLLSAYNTLLYRYTKQEDIVIGFPNIEYIFGETGDSIIPLRNTKVYRADLSGNPCFNELLNRVNQVVLNGNKHKAVQYKELEEDRKLICGTNYPMLYNVIFSFRTIKIENDGINEWASNGCVPENARGYIDLALYLEETSQGLNGIWTYNSELFEAVTIGRLAKHFEVLLEGIISDPQQNISQLPLLTDTEYHQLTLDWNSSKVNCPADKCIHELFELQVRKTPGATALVFEKAGLTYAELNERSNQLAHYLRSRGVKKETLVPVLIDHSPEMIIGILGILKSGGAYVPIDPNYPLERISYLLEDTKAFIAICNKESKLLSQAFKNIELFDLTGEGVFLKDQPADNLNINLSSDSLAYVIYTSGTTGKPKGVMIEHRSLADHCYGVIQSADLQTCKSFALFSPLVFDAGHSIIHSSFILGACLHVLSKPLIMNSENVAAYLDNNSIDCIKIVPSLWLSYAGLEKMVVSKKVIIFGGEVFPLGILNCLKKINYGGSVYNHYGPTEVTIGKCIHKVSIDQAYNTVPIGKPFSNTQLYILDDHLQLAPVGIEGELYIAGEGLSRGYLNQPDLTVEKFISNPFTSNPSDRMYKTGDKVKWLLDGNIEYLGRMDEQVKIQGHRIELGEIEQALLQSQLVQQAVVIAHVDKKGNKQLIGCVVPGKQYNQEALIAFLRKKLPEYMIPVKCIELENLPLTNNGKINKKELEDLNGIDKAFIAPTTEIEIKLAVIWQALLNTEKISIHDNFFELGGNSIHAVFLFAKIKKEFNKSFPLSALFTAPTIYQLASALKLTTKTFLASSSIVPIQPNGSKPPFFCLHAGHGNVLFYASLSLNLGQDQPFYGIQAKGIDGTELPFTKMGQMVNYYIGEIRKVQPEGPYYLGGYCFGARIAFEMAQQLTYEGQKVALLVSFNGVSPTYGRLKFKSTGRFQRVTEKIFSHLNYITKLSLKEKILYISNKVTTQILGRLSSFLFLLKYKAYELIFKFYLLRKQKVPEIISRKYVAQSLEILQSNYKPKPYDGSMVVFRSPGIFSKDSYLGWKSFVKGEIKTIDIPGRHEWRRDILNQPHVQILAKELESVLNK